MIGDFPMPDEYRKNLKIIAVIILKFEQGCYCCVGVLRPFDTFQVISGAVS